MDPNDIADILKEIDAVQHYNHTPKPGLTNIRITKIRSETSENFAHKIVHLVDSHVPTLRERAVMKYGLIISKGDSKDPVDELKLLKNLLTTHCDENPENKFQTLKKWVAQMPKEWTIIQITSKFNPREPQNLNPKKCSTNGLNLIHFDCGQSEFEPSLVEVDEPHHNGNKLDLMQILTNAIDKHISLLSAQKGRKFFRNRSEREHYNIAKEEIETTLQGVTSKTETSWLRHWRCFFVGKYENALVDQDFRSELDKIIKKHSIKITNDKTKLLLHIFRAAGHLTSAELSEAVQHCTADNSEIEEELQEKYKSVMEKYPDTRRYPVILVVDEMLDLIPWEMMDIVNGEPVSRIPSLHFVYFLYKTHQQHIKEGNRTIVDYTNGKFVVNPDADLPNMSKRILAFYKHWLPKWNGISDRKPDQDTFCELMKSADIFLYNGHGNGTHIMTAETLQKVHIKAAVLLFGCSSTSISQISTNVEPYGSYHMYLLSRCPCVLGMLWPVTDVHTDILTTELLSRWVPSKAKEKWSCSELQSKVVNFDDLGEKSVELLRALTLAKKYTNFLTRSACVIRGLPVKIKQ